MDMKSVIAQLTAERDRIDGVIRLLSTTGSVTGKRRGRPPGSGKASPTPGPAAPIKATKKRQMSAAGRKRIAEAQRKRWAALKKLSGA